MWKGLRVQICISQASSAKYSDMCHTKPLICFSCPYTRCRANTSYDIELNILNDISSEMSIEWAVPPRVLIPNLLRASSLHLSLSRDSTGFVWLGCGLESIPLLIPPSSWPIYFRPICWHHNKFSQTPHSLTIFIQLI